jgi:hypothetical protein
MTEKDLIEFLETERNKTLIQYQEFLYNHSYNGKSFETFRCKIEIVWQV